MFAVWKRKLMLTHRFAQKAKVILASGQTPSLASPTSMQVLRALALPFAVRRHRQVVLEAGAWGNWPAYGCLGRQPSDPVNW